ncbi:hypothetical protein BGW42_007450, partial [Actinomortierella wolfii]
APGSPSARRHKPQASLQMPASTRRNPKGEVAQWACSFYKHDGPSCIMELWSKKLGRKRKQAHWDENFVNSAVDVVVHRTRRDLWLLNGVVGDDGPEEIAYQFPTVSVTQANIDKILSPGFLSGYASRAAYLKRFLRGVLQKDKKGGFKGSKRMFEDEDEVKDKSGGGGVMETGPEETKPKGNGDEEIENKDKDKSNGDGVMETEAEESKPKGNGDEEIEDEELKDEEFEEGEWPDDEYDVDEDYTEEGAVVMESGPNVDDEGRSKEGAPTGRRYTRRRNPDVLSALGLCVSENKVQAILRNLTKDAMVRVREAVLSNDWFLVYDNINIAARHHHQRLSNPDTFDNGTAATVILISQEDNKKLTEGDKEARQGESAGQHDDLNGEHNKHEDNHRAPETVEVVRPARSAAPFAFTFITNFENAAYFLDACRHHFASTIARSQRMLHPPGVIPLMPIDRLPVRKTITFPLPTMKFDESTIAGNLAVLEHVTTVGLRLRLARYFSDVTRVIVAGDQMTMARLWTLKFHRAITNDPFSSLGWVHPIPQLFHLRMTLCGTIFRTYYGDEECPGPGTLADIIAALGYKYLTKKNIIFKVADELLKITFEALLLLLWNTLQDLRNPGEAEIVRVTDIIIDVLGGPDSPLKGSSDSTHQLFGRSCTTADINALMFLRDVAVYIDLEDAIRNGDIGRIRAVLPIITTMMHGGGNTNYAREMLRLLYGMRHAWT